MWFYAFVVVFVGDIAELVHVRKKRCRDRCVLAVAQNIFSSDSAEVVYFEC